MIAAAPPRPEGPRPWWESRPFVAALILLSLVPLLTPQVPPLVDLLGHIGRYRVQLDLHSSPWLQRYYDFEWAPIGNLGMDLLMVPLSRLFGLELAAKLIVLAIPPMTVAGFLWVAREVHNRVPPTAFFALPLAYGHPFLFGFTNFALSMAFAFLAFGLWLRLGRLERTGLRAAIFLPISIIVFFTHTFGWGTLGLLAFSAEAVRQHDKGVGWLRAGFNAAFHAASMALPMLFMLLWRSETPGDMAIDWFNFAAKYEWLLMVFRDRWRWFDIGSVIVLLLVIAEAFRNRHLGFSRNLVFTALVLGAMFVLLPRIVFGSAYADMRLAPYLLAIVILAIRFREETHLQTARVIAVLGLAFFVTRIGANTLSLGMAARDQQPLLEMIDRLPVGARVATFVGAPCVDGWEMARNSHISGMIIARRQGFSNDQWQIAGSNLLTVRYRAPGIYYADPSQIVRPNHCRPRVWKIDMALQYLPRHAFDYVWLIDVPEHDARLLDGLQPVWRGEGALLYRIQP